MLTQALEAELGHPVPTDLAYNQTHGFFADIAQTFYQLSQQDPDTAPEKIAEALLYGNAPEGMDQRIAEGAIRYYQAKAEQAALAQLTLDEESEILRDIRSASAKAEKVLLVPHSQGNLFANRMYTLLTDSGALQPQDLRIHGAASPADRVLGGGSYLTSRNDVVIASLDILRKVLPHNIEIPRTQSDLLGHGFKEVYLNPALNGRQAMLDGMVAAMKAMNGNLNPLYADNPALQGAPLVLDYYGLPYDEILWNQWVEWLLMPGSLVPTHPYYNDMYLKGPRGLWRWYWTPGKPRPDLDDVVGVLAIKYDDRGWQRVMRALTCESLTPGGPKLEPGVYEIGSDIPFYGKMGEPESVLNYSSGFAISIQGKRYEYLYGVATQKRTYEDLPVPFYNNTVAGGFNIALGKVIVTQDESTGSFEITWHPTPELAATEVKQP
ncbi:hypothetical protein GCM10007860_23640 [Chitiniphilus shinanonensis]|uniref:Lipoprotein n=2 Tax=Chitiniphilus shinanonensis TaxID=553088 RepID=A0ABQ6BZR5_9NEIS|nr:hypothetical protein GCM10007860_23640 [Chitiniphilus shinanonensis]